MSGDGGNQPDVRLVDVRGVDDLVQRRVARADDFLVVRLRHDDHAVPHANAARHRGRG